MIYPEDWAKKQRLTQMFWHRIFWNEHSYRMEKEDIANKDDL